MINMEKMKMKNIRIAMICMLAVAGMMAGCKKDTGKVSLTASIVNETNDGKVVLDEDNYPVWESTDQVWVNGTAYNLVANSIQGNKATIDADLSDDGYLAVFPADAVESYSGTTVTVTIPRQQTYAANTSGGQKIIAPMTAYTTGRNLRFRNVCSLIKVHVVNNTSTAFTVKRIAVTSSAPITGSASTTAIDGGTTSPTVSNGFYDAVLQIPTQYRTAIAANGGTADYYVAVAPMSNANVTISVYTTDDEHRSVKFTGATLSQSHVKEVSIISNSTTTLNDEPYIDGHYTVNASGTQVRFARGNLQNRPNEGNRYFRIADNQYDYVGDNSKGTVYHNGTKCSNSKITDVSAGYAGLLDLFGWGTGNNGYNNSYNNADYGPNGTATTLADPYEWGSSSRLFYGPVANARQTGINTWRTLTQGEWQYLLYTRTASTINGVPNAHFLKVALTGVSTHTPANTSIYGIMLFPDVITWPTSVTLPTAACINSASADFTSYTADNLVTLQKEGVVFLPFAGMRSSSSTATSINNCNNSIMGCNYWTASPDPNNGSNALAFRYYYYSTNSTYNLKSDASAQRRYGYAVRLVHNVQ